MTALRRRARAPEDVLEVVMLWGTTPLDAHHRKAGERLTVGSEEADFKIGSGIVPEENFSLVTPGGELQVAEGMNLVVRREGRARTLQDLERSGALSSSDDARIRTYRLARDEHATVVVGNLRFVCRWIAAPRGPAALLAAADYHLARIGAISLLLHLAFLEAMRMSPLDRQTLSDDLFKQQSRFKTYVIKPPAPANTKKAERLAAAIARGAKAREAEGQFGKKTATQKEAQRSKPGAPIVDPNKREKDRRKISRMGILGALDAGGASSNILGPGGLGASLNAALGGISDGRGLGDAHGLAGLGLRGMGPGGGGAGNLGLGSVGSGHGADGDGNLQLGARDGGKGGTRIQTGKTTVQGALSKDVIARVIKRHENEIKFCYEKELSRDPTLDGKVGVNFVIDATGGVAQAVVAQSTMDNHNVEQCMLQAVRRWKFPQPQGGGVVIVTYPWVFKPAG